MTIPVFEDKTGFEAEVDNLRLIYPYLVEVLIVSVDS